MARTTTLQLANLDPSDFDRPVTCPAGVRIGQRDGSPACRCAIEESIISAESDGSSLLGYCMGDGSLRRPGYTACPTWRTQREADWANRGRIVPEGAGV